MTLHITNCTFVQAVTWFLSLFSCSYMIKRAQMYTTFEGQFCSSSFDNLCHIYIHTYTWMCDLHFETTIISSFFTFDETISIYRHHISSKNKRMWTHTEIFNIRESRKIITSCIYDITAEWVLVSWKKEEKKKERRYYAHQFPLENNRDNEEYVYIYNFRIASHTTYLIYDDWLWHRFSRRIRTTMLSSSV